MQTTAFAEDLADTGGDLEDAVGAGVDGLGDSLGRWQLPPAWEDLTALAACNPEKILARLDKAVSDGRVYIWAYAEALGDGTLSREEVQVLNQRLADWRADLAALDSAMREAFELLAKSAAARRSRRTVSSAAPPRR